MASHLTTTSDRASADVAPGPADRWFGSREQLRWFVTLWVMAAALHYTDSNPRAVLPILAFGLPALLFPTNLWAVGLFVALVAVDGALALPAPANHKMVNLLVALALTAAALCAVATRDNGEPFVHRWLAAARTPVGLTLLVVYLFTVVHKLNTAFFDPAVSCAGHLFRQMAGLNGLGRLELNPTAGWALAVGTVAVEAAILVLLAVPRLRPWGLLVGISFHALLAPASFWDFATVVFALYVLLVPNRVFAELAPRFQVVRRWALGAFAVHLIMSAGASYTGTEVSPYGLTWHTLQVLTWYAIVLPLMLPLLDACLIDRHRRDDPASAWPVWRWRPLALLVVPLLAFANGAMPYLGLKTVSSFSMFSNLHTEQGAANHLLPGLSALHVVDYQRDVVTVTQVDGPRGTLGKSKWLRERTAVTVPWLELRRVVGRWNDASIHPVRVDYLRNGTPYSAPDATSDPELGRPLPWWQRTLLAFRAIDSGDGPDHCRW